MWIEKAGVWTAAKVALSTVVAAVALAGCGRAASQSAATLHEVEQSRDPLLLAHQYPNYPQDPAFFPIAVWYEAANRPGSSDHANYATEAAGAAAVGINILEGTFPGGPTWPERFGGDEGELAALKAAHVYFFAGDPQVDFGSTTSARSAASILALLARSHAQSTVIGYMGPDEPHCNSNDGGAPFTSEIAAGVALVRQQDPTRPVMVNMTNWTLTPSNIGGVDTNNPPISCLASKTKATQASAIASFDFYPNTNSYAGRNSDGVAQHGAASDYITVGNDNLWKQALSVSHMAHFSRRDQPIWEYVDAGGDALTSPTNNSFDVEMTAGSTVLTVRPPLKVTPSWNGMVVEGSGIAHGTTVTFLDSGHATMSSPASATASKTQIGMSGGVVYHGRGSSCVRSINLCLTTGQEYRLTPAQVNAEMWNGIIAGATGVEWFCQDGVSQAFCLGGNDGGKQSRDDARVVVDNLRYIDGVLKSMGAMLNSQVMGQCLMDFSDYATNVGGTVASCSGGILALETDKPAVPGLALVHSYAGATWLIAQSDRRSSAGATFTFTLKGLAGKTATVVYDSNAQYDPPHAALNATFTLSGAARFADTLGANGDDYQVKIYSIQ